MEQKRVGNYIIQPTVLFKITKKSKTEYENFTKNYEILIDEFKDSIINAYRTMIQKDDRSIKAGTEAKRAQEYVN